MSEHDEPDPRGRRETAAPDGRRRDAGPPGGAGSGAMPETGEAGGPKGLEPTRYGDWERNGRCIDF